MNFKLISSILSLLFSLFIVYTVFTYSHIEKISNKNSPDINRIEVVSPAMINERNHKIHDHGCPYLRQAIEKGCPAFSPGNSSSKSASSIKTSLL
jgi:hypothetical protein